MTLNLFKYETFIFDLDGCLYSGNLPYPGAISLISFLKEENKSIFFLSNNSKETSQEVMVKLAKLGFRLEGTTTLVATELVGQYILDHYGEVTVSVIGSKSLENSLRQCGHRVVPLHENDTEYIVLSRDTRFSYRKLLFCANKVLSGAKLIATNADFYHPGHSGRRIPETGALLVSVAAMADNPDVITVGKPNPYPFQKVLALTRTSRRACLMIGDNIYTDIQGGHAAGLDTLWISHQKLLPEGLNFWPTYQFTTIEQLYNVLRKGGDCDPYSGRSNNQHTGSF